MNLSETYCIISLRSISKHARVVDAIEFIIEFCYYMHSMMKALDQINVVNQSLLFCDTRFSTECGV